MTTTPIRARTPGTVDAQIETIDDRPAVVMRLGRAADPGPLLPADGETMAAAAEAARSRGIPLVGYFASTGADIGSGIDAVHGWGVAARSIVRCSGVVPIALSVTGPAVSGPALLLGLADHVVMTDDAYAFVSGPHMVELYTGVALTTGELGGAQNHARTSGTASLLVPDVDQAGDAIAQILGYFPSNADELPRRWATADPVSRPTPEAGALLPTSPTGSYDVRSVLRAVADDNHILELRAGWAPNIVTALTTIGGESVGMVANQPQALAGTLDIPASQKGARFVALCDAFNLPLVTFVDTPGFYPGKDLEWRGMIRHGAQLAFAYARATVPRVCITLRKSYGGAYIVMDSKHMGNDLSYAWPTAEIAVMGAKGAVEILHRRASPEERAELEVDYEERLLNPYIAASRGSIDGVIDPSDTRTVIASALQLLAGKRERLAPRTHDNTPL